MQELLTASQLPQGEVPHPAAAARRPPSRLRGKKARLARGLAALVLATALTMSGRSAAADPPARMVSLNLCLDQLALELAAPGQLVGVSDMARDPYLSAGWRRARAVPAVRLRVEEILALRPDLVLLHSDAPAPVVALLRRTGARVALFPEAITFEAALGLIQHVANVLERSDAGAAMVDTLRRRYAALTDGMGERRPLAAVWQASGFTVGVGSLPDDLLRRAGWRNLAAERGTSGFGPLPLETLLRAAPDLLILDGATSAAPSLAEGLMTHRAARRAFGDARTLVMPHHLWLCAGPQNLDAMERLAAAHRQAKATP
jgi:iron complex transport system substrate-binding protein